MRTPKNEPEQTVPTDECQDCGQPFKTAQGLAGHRRLAHSASTRTELDERRRSDEQREAELRARETAADRRVAEADRRQREIAETGPFSIGLNRCNYCKAWFEDSDGLQAHSRAVHPLEPRIAEELGVHEGTVSYVWNLAKRYTANHPDEGPEEIERRFWWEKERHIYRRLRELNASFEEGG